MVKKINFWYGSIPLTGSLYTHIIYESYPPKTCRQGTMLLLRPPVQHANLKHHNYISYIFSPSATYRVAAIYDRHDRQDPGKTLSPAFRRLLSRRHSSSYLLCHFTTKYFFPSYINILCWRSSSRRGLGRDGTRRGHTDTSKCMNESIARVLIKHPRLGRFGRTENALPRRIPSSVLWAGRLVGWSSVGRERNGVKCS